MFVLRARRLDALKTALRKTSRSSRIREGAAADAASLRQEEGATKPLIVSVSSARAFLPSPQWTTRNRPPGKAKHLGMLR